MSTTDNKYTDKRHQIAKDPKKKQRNKFILFGILTISFIFLIVLGTGYVIRYIIPQGKTVVQVGEIKYNRADMLKMLRVKQKNSEMIGSQMNNSEEIFKALQNMIENEIMNLILFKIRFWIFNKKLLLFLLSISSISLGNFIRDSEIENLIKEKKIQVTDKYFETFINFKIFFNMPNSFSSHSLNLTIFPSDKCKCKNALLTLHPLQPKVIDITSKFLYVTALILAPPLLLLKLQSTIYVPFFSFH